MAISMRDDAYKYWEEERRQYEVQIGLLQLQLQLERHQRQRAPAAIQPDMLKRLKSLCHPDRWQGQPQERTATEVMQFLNSLEDRP